MEAPVLARALALAVTAHEGQYRKGGRVPYAVHPLRVVGRVHSWGIEDPEVLAAAALHDVLEDTDVTGAELEGEFGPRVHDLVVALTHESDLAPRERTRVILDQLGAAPLEAVVVKLADRLDNMGEMTGWRPTSRLGYLGEALEIARLARERLAAGEGDPVVRAALERALPEYEREADARREEAEDDLAARPGRAGRRGRR